MKELGSGKYLPTVFDYFPRTARGHGAQDRHTKIKDAAGDLVGRGSRSNPLCQMPTCATTSRTGRGDQHIDQRKNREEWEASVGIRRASKATRGAHHTQVHAALARLDPKDFQSLTPATI